MERIDWPNDESVVRAAVPSAYQTGTAKILCKEPIPDALFPKFLGSSWETARLHQPAVAALDQAHEAVVERWPDAVAVNEGYAPNPSKWIIYRREQDDVDLSEYCATEAAAWISAASRLSEPVAVAKRSSGEEGFEGVISRYIARRDALPSSPAEAQITEILAIHTQHERDQFNTITDLRKLLDEAIAEVARLRGLLALGSDVPEHHTSPKEYAFCRALIEINPDPAFINKMTMMFMEATLERALKGGYAEYQNPVAKSSDAPAKVTWRVDHKREDDVWRMSAHSTGESMGSAIWGKIEPAQQHLIGDVKVFGEARLVKITTTEEVTSHRSKEKEA